MNRSISLLLAVLFFSLVNAAAADDIPARPDPPRLVNDLADMLRPDEEAALEAKLNNYNDTTSTQIAVVTINSLNGNDISDYTNRLAIKWGVGQKGKDNGLVILLSKEDRKWWIEVGYGLEGVITDGVAKRIGEEVMVPEFKNNNFYGGIDKGTDIIIKRAYGEFKGDGRRKKEGVSTWTVIVIIFILIFIFSRFRGGGGGGTFSHRGYRGGGFMGGGFGGFGGGSSSGGFAGFGGGSFGGGGAGGRW